jgi:hypothetical protein
MLLTARGSLLMQLRDAMLGCAAALRGIFAAMSRTLNCSLQSSQPTLRVSYHGQPNKSLEWTRHQRRFYPRGLRYCLGSRRAIQFQR